MKLKFLVLIFLATLACSKDPTKPGYQVSILTDMMYAVPYEAGSKNPVFANGLTNQTPPPETIARDALLDDPFREAPQNLTKDELARGKFVFENYCLMCHGPLGEGDGQLIPRYPNPPDFNSIRVAILSTDQLFNSVSNGKRDMPAHAGQLEVLDRWRVVYYIKTLMGQGAR